MKKILIGILMLAALAFSVSAHPYIVEVLGDTTVNETQTVNLMLRSTFPDNGTSIFNKNVTFGSLNQINETNAQFTWATTYSSKGTYDIKFSVSDLDSIYNQTITINVLNVNRAPTINLPASKTVVQGIAESVSFTASDPDVEDSLTYSVTAENTSQVDCGVSSSTLTMTAAAGYTGTASCTVQASDGSLTATDSIIITVQAQNPSVSIADIDFGNVELNTTAIQKVLTITNNGNMDLHNLNLVWDSSYNKYNINYTTSLPSTLTKGTQYTTNIRFYVPADQDTGSLTIPVTFTSNELNKNFSLKAEVLGRLRITDLDVKVDENTDSNLADKEDGYKIGEKAIPQSHLKFDVRVENTFPNDGLDIENVFVRVTILDIDDGEDLEEESEEFDINADSSDRVTLEFDVPLKVDEASYDVIIEVEGEDEDGTEHKVTKNLVLEVEKESHALLVRRASISPETVECTRTASLDVGVINIGTNDEDAVLINIKNTALGIDLTEKDIELSSDPTDDDNEFSKTFDLNIKDTVKAGTYTIEVKAYYDDDKLEDLQRVNLQVKDCKPIITPPAEEEEEEETEVITPPAEEEEQTVTPPVQPAEKKFTESTEYVLLLVLVNIIVVIVVIALLIALLRK